MATLAYVCRIRTDVPASAMQWTDIIPNTSQRNLIYDGPGQTGYLLDDAENDTLSALSGGTTTAAEYKGVAAYLIDHIIDNVSAVTITVTVANAAALAIIALKDAGSAVTSTAVATALVTGGGAGAGTTLTSSGGTGLLTDILKILSGGKYTLPSGSLVGGLAAGAGLGSFDATVYRQLYLSGSLVASCTEGQLNGFSSASFSYMGTTGAALVVYDDAGALLT